jgi:hypothetical protein
MFSSIVKSKSTGSWPTTPGTTNSSFLGAIFVEILPLPSGSERC